MRQKGAELATYTHNTIYNNIGWYTGEILREDIEQRIRHIGVEDISLSDKIVCYFAHDSTLGSFYYAFELDKKFNEQHFLDIKFCSYFAIECTISLDQNNGKQIVEKVVKYVDFEKYPEEMEIDRAVIEVEKWEN